MTLKHILSSEKYQHCWKIQRPKCIEGCWRGGHFCPKAFANCGVYFVNFSFVLSATKWLLHQDMSLVFKSSIALSQILHTSKQVGQNFVDKHSVLQIVYFVYTYYVTYYVTENIHLPLNFTLKLLTIPQAIIFQVTLIKNGQ